MKHHPLDDQATQIVQRYRGEETKLISILQEIEAKRVFKKLGYNSMHEYCEQRLKLSSSRAFELIYVSRTCTKVPQVRVAIETGVVSVSAAKRIGSVVTKRMQTFGLSRRLLLDRRIWSEQLRR